MAKPSKERVKAIQRAEKKLLELSKQLQSEYFDKVWRSISASVERGNFTAVASNPIFVKAWQSIVGKGINAFLKSELMEIEKTSSVYYSQFTPAFLEFSQVQKIVTDDLRRNLAQFANSYNISTVAANNLRSFVLGQIGGGVSFADARKNANNFANGTAQKLGVVDNFNLVQSRIQDTFAEYDRRLSNKFADRLQLNYFIYQGGEIKTTREFCEERNGGVFTREEGVSWNELQWEGKKVGHNVLIDAGGYNCRHYLDWISYELAKQLRPDIERSVFDVTITD
jgi:hypothetical protein